MFDPDEVFPIKNGTKINLLSWKTQKYLNSHTVAAPVSKDLLEVTGYINHNVGMEPELIWEVILPPPAEVWMRDLVGVQLRHVNSGRMLTVTGKKYPDDDWGEKMREVAGARSGVGNNKWKVGFYRTPNYGEKKKT